MGRDEALLSVVDDIGAMAIEVAKKIIKTEVSCDETLVLGLVKDSIQKVGRSAKTITIRVHPEEVLIVRNHLAKNPPVQVNAEIITLDDMNVEPGSCIIETNSGLIDASFKTQFEVLQGIFGIKEIQ
jgi:flagellar biosynthesis/type III secretory pathway protein FliH